MTQQPAERHWQRCLQVALSMLEYDQKSGGIEYAKVCYARRWKTRRNGARESFRRCRRSGGCRLQQCSCFVLEGSHGDRLAKAFGGDRQRLHYVRMRIHLMSLGPRGFVHLVNACGAECCGQAGCCLRSQGGWEFWFSQEGMMG